MYLISTALSMKLSHVPLFTQVLHIISCISLLSQWYCLLEDVQNSFHNMTDAQANTVGFELVSLMLPISDKTQCLNQAMSFLLLSFHHEKFP